VIDAILTAALLSAALLTASAIFVLVREFEWWSILLILPLGLTGLTALGMVFNLLRQRSWE
jgi:hypothetical protein